MFFPGSLAAMAGFVVAAATSVNAAPAASALLSLKYQHLPLGQIKPNGWLADQLQIQANGLAGHEHDFYDYVENSTWTGGSSTYSDLHEGGSYWFNGLVAHAFVANDARLKAQVQSFLDYIIAHQGSDGWLGPSTPRYLWGRYPVLLGMMQFAEADPTQTDKIVGSMMKFVTLAHSMLANNGTGVEEWGAARWQDFALVCQWLYENYPNGQQAMLLDTMHLLRTTGVDWVSAFSPSNFPTDSVPASAANTLNHGVNLGQALKAEAVAWRFSQNQSDQDATTQHWDILYQYHGLPSGVFAADEHLAGKDPQRGTELCTVVETMFSGSHTYQGFGNNSIADLVERMAYNALPAMLTSNMWSRQYLQQLNQIYAKDTAGQNPFLTDGSYSNVFGLQPNYPCCTVNHPQGFPKFVSNAFVTADNGSALVQAYLGPFVVNTTLVDTNPVSVTVDTNYPFADTITVFVIAAKPYTHYMRVPEWAKRNGKGTIAVNGGAAQTLAPNADSLQAIQVSAGTTSFVLTLPGNIELTQGVTGGVHVNRGPLLFSSDIFRTEKNLSTNPINPNAVDIEMDHKAGYNFAIDTSTLAFHNKLPASVPSPIFEGQMPPNTITATGCPITWGDNGASVNDPPTSPVTCTGVSFNFIFWPYGSTKLRIAEVPTFTAQVGVPSAPIPVTTPNPTPTPGHSNPSQSAPGSSPHSVSAAAPLPCLLSIVGTANVFAVLGIVLSAL